MGKIKETLVDVIIYSVLMAEAYNLDIDQIVQEKIELMSKNILLRRLSVIKLSAIS